MKNIRNPEGAFILEITAISTYDLKTCKAIQKYTMFGKNSPVKRMLFWGIIYFILLFAVASLLVADSSDVTSWILFILIAAVLIVFCISYFHTPKVRYKALGNLKDTQNYYRFRKTEFSVTSDTDAGKESKTFKYDSIGRIAETSKYFFIHQLKGGLYAIEKSTIQNGTSEQLKSLLLTAPSVKYIKCRY